MPSPGYHTINYSSAKELWDSISPEKTISGHPSGKFIFRGQGDAKQGLVPSVFRANSPIHSFVPQAILTTEMEVLAEMQLIRQFVDCCDSLSLPIPNDSVNLRRRLNSNDKGQHFISFPSAWPSGDLAGVLALAQHHGVPTRLLDWTKRSYVGAYFAASSALTRSAGESEQIAIWAMDTAQLLPLGLLEDLPTTGIYPHVRVVTTPGAVTANLAAQAGLFTVLTESGQPGQMLVTKSLDEEFSRFPESPLWKLTLPASESAALMELCRVYSVSAATLFPRYDGAGAAVLEIARSWKKMPP